MTETNLVHAKQRRTTFSAAKASGGGGGLASLIYDDMKDLHIGKSSPWDSIPIVESNLRTAWVDLHYDFQTRTWTFRDDRGFKATVFAKKLFKGGSTLFKSGSTIGRWKAECLYASGLYADAVWSLTTTDKLLRYWVLQDDRGVDFSITLDPEMSGRRIHAPVLQGPPITAVHVPEFGKITNNKQGGIMPSTKNTNEKETPIEQTQPKLGLYFRINDLPQELSQKQTIEHVTKLLTLGASTVHVTRYIRDDVSARTATSW